MYFNSIHQGEASDQKFTALIPYLNEFDSGESACVINHGVTGGGKTFCMFGTADKMGILQRSVNHLLETNNAICLKAIELVGEETYDLLNGGAKSVGRATEKFVKSSDDFLQIVSVVSSHRKQQQTDQNVTSSRSHLLITLKIDSSSVNELVMVDLAGFERPKGKENGVESLFINSSLSHLNNVLMNIARKQVVNYKLCALTKLLQPHLSASSRTIMLYHLAPHSVKKGLEYIKDIAASNKILKRNANGSFIIEMRKPLRGTN